MGEKFTVPGIISSELAPGTMPRRWSPPGGEKKYRERIHKESKHADNKNLPFTFRKPPKPKGRSLLLKCDNCGAVISGTTVTVGIICSSCGKFSTVSAVED